MFQPLGKVLKYAWESQWTEGRLNSETLIGAHHELLIAQREGRALKIAREKQVAVHSGSPM